MKTLHSLLLTKPMLLKRNGSAFALTAMLGLPLAIAVFIAEQRRERRNEEDEVYQLLSDAYNADRRMLIDRERASLEQRPGKLDGYGGVVKLRRADASRLGVASSGAGEPTVGRVGQTTGDTVHFDIVDRDGNMISATPSGGWLQSSPVIPELGFPLGTRGQMFWLEEGLPGSLAPGKRPRATRRPTIRHRPRQPAGDLIAWAPSWSPALRATWQWPCRLWAASSCWTWSSAGCRPRRTRRSPPNSDGETP